MKNNVNIILDELDRLIGNPVTELTYHNDYELLMVVVLSSQTTDKRVNSVTPLLFSKYPSLKALKEANIKDLETILRPIGTYRRKAFYIKEIATKLHDHYNGKVPNDRAALESLPGVGHKTANVVLSILYNEPCIAVDTHVSRVSKRLGLAEELDDVKAIEQKLMSLINKDKWSKSHHQLVLFGRYHCKAIKPNCYECKLHSICQYKKE